MAERKKKKGREQHRRSREGRQRGDARKVKRRRTEVGDEEFFFVALRGRKRPVNLDPIVESCSWEDARALMTGSLSLRRRLVDPRKPVETDVSEGDQIVCKYRKSWGRGRPRELWRMRVADSSDGVAEGTTELTLESELVRAQRTRLDYEYRSKKKGSHPRGWRCDEIARDACKKSRLRVGRLARGKHRIKKLVEPNASPYEVVVKAYTIERRETGRRFLVDFRRGRLDVTVLKHPVRALRIAGSLIDATVTRAAHPKGATAVTVRGSAKKGQRKKRKIKTLVVSRRARRIGWIHRYMRVGQVESVAEARKRARRWLTEVWKPKREVTFTHPGIPTLRRGDALTLSLDGEGIRKELCYVKEVRHSVAAGAYDMEVTVTFDDPYIDKAAERSKEKREDRARERGRKRGDHGDRRESRPRSREHGQRQNARRSTPPATRGDRFIQR